MTASFGTRCMRVVRAIGDPSAWRTTRFVHANRRGEASPCAGQPSQPLPIENPSLDAWPDRMDGIPPIVFQTWKSRTHIPANYRYWRQSFVDLNPDHAVLLWDDADNRSFIARHYPWFLPVYDGYPAEIYRADAVRPFFLFHHGGLYADMDTECLRPIRNLPADAAVLLCRMGGDTAFEHSIPNAIMAARPRQMFWLYMIAMMMRRARSVVKPLGPEAMTGPILLRDAYEDFRRMDESGATAAVRDVLEQLAPNVRSSVRYAPVTLLDPNEWYPLDWTNPFHKLLCNQLRAKRQILERDQSTRLFPNSSLVTYWSHSW